MVSVRLTPGDAAAGGTRMFTAVGFDFDIASRQLVLLLRDGNICIKVMGDWEVTVRSMVGVPHTVDEAVRIHEGRSLLLVN